jgi:DNA invertase Pin-like site-specific DNA recombinase
MSTEHQRYSIEFQQAANAAYALEHGIQIVRTYADAGVSGVTLNKRWGLKSLVRDVLAGGADFTIVLVYDVSRWGRFQDPDQSAHYEFICREAGVRVEYCAEPFDNDGSLSSSIVKQLKRAMAAEYSRELSVKVNNVQRRLAQHGYRVSGAAGYGLRRMMIDPTGRSVGILERGERKAIQGYRIKLVPGPPEEVAVVRRIFRMFTIFGMTMTGIVETLNAQNVDAGGGRLWSITQVRGILKNEKYIGNNVFGRTSAFLHGPRRSEPREACPRAGQ